MPILAYLLAAVAGACLVVQQPMNAHLRFDLSAPGWAGAVSYLVGLTCMVGMAMVLREPFPTLAVAARVPAWAWLGGAFGSTFIALSIFLAPQIGAATFFALVVAGQMVAAILFDQFGVMGLAQRSVDLPRLIGVALLVGGVVLIRR